MNDYKYAGIETYDINNGTGFGVTFFVQGCSHHCKNCHNPQTWDFNGGNQLTNNTVDSLIKLFNDDNIVRLTISGGEPFDNIELTNNIAASFKLRQKNKQLWLYSGYTFEQLRGMAEAQDVLRLCDVLVDGEFQIEHKDLSLAFRGSSNQRIIDVQKSLQSGTTELYYV